MISLLLYYSGLKIDLEESVQLYIYLNQFIILIIIYIDG